VLAHAVQARELRGVRIRGRREEQRERADVENDEARERGARGRLEGAGRVVDPVDERRDPGILFWTVVGN
jgi:hypothetical protein